MNVYFTWLLATIAGTQFRIVALLLGALTLGAGQLLAAEITTLRKEIATLRTAAAPPVRLVHTPKLVGHAVNA